MYVLSSSTFVDGREFQHVNAHKCKTGNKDLTTKMKKVASVDDCQALCYAQDSCLVRVSLLLFIIILLSLLFDS